MASISRQQNIHIFLALFIKLLLTGLTIIYEIGKYEYYQISLTKCKTQCAIHLF
jgi:hypothetical protein